MTTIFDRKETKVRNHSGVNRLTIPDDWARILNLQAGQECEIALANGKHGLFFAVWSKDQPTVGDVDEEL